MFAEINNLSDTSLVAPYKLIGEDALSVLNAKTFGILYFTRVPKTGSRTWLYRISQICNMSLFFNENDKFYPIKLDNEYQVTFVAANKYQKFAKFAIKYD